MARPILPCCCQFPSCCTSPSQKCDDACCMLTFRRVMFTANHTSPSSTACGTNCCPCPSIMRSPRVIANNCARYGSTCQEPICDSCSGYRC